MAISESRRHDRPSSCGKENNYRTPAFARLGFITPGLVNAGVNFFITRSEKDSAARHLMCFSATSGSVQWNRTYSAKPYKQHKLNDYASSTPAVDADHVYALWFTPEDLTLVALDHEGKDVWKASLGK